MAECWQWAKAWCFARGWRGSCRDCSVALQAIPPLSPRKAPRPLAHRIIHLYAFPQVGAVGYELQVDRVLLINIVSGFVRKNEGY